MEKTDFFKRSALESMVRISKEQVSEAVEENIIANSEKESWAINQYKILPAKEWEMCQWLGFACEFGRYRENCVWEYVPNLADGYLGLSWHYVSNNEAEMYLHFDQSKLSVKICYVGGDRLEIRKKYSDLLMTKANEAKVIMERPIHLGAGIKMTIGVVPSDVIFGTGGVDMEALMERVKRYEELIDKCMDYGEETK